MTTAAQTPSALRSTCPYCGVGCGVIAEPDGDGGVSLRGDPDHPANKGRLCSKGSALAETTGLGARLLAPQMEGAETSWDTALDRVADTFRDTIAEHGPDSVAFYVSGQLLTEDYYVANKLIKGFMGTANIDTNSRLCMASTVAGHKRAFGTDTVPGSYEDIEEADLVVLVGSNLAWCHPVLYQRLAAAKAERPNLKVVTIDPRRTATSGLADLHLGLTPGSDVALFNGLLEEVISRGALDAEFIGQHVSGFHETREAVSTTDLSATGLSGEDLRAFFNLWIGTEKVVTIFSQGVNQSSSGTDKVNAILNCHLATGRIGKPGMGPFSVTGQPNAMGGREVGGLANMLACHLDIENAEHRAAVRGFWDSPAVPETAGLKAVDMFDAVEDGRIKALWVMCSNPAVSMPDADRVRDAIAACPFVVVSDITAETDTARLADVLLPATGWGEKDGTVTNSDRTISRQRKFLPAPGWARPDWQIISDVAARLGWGAQFDYRAPVDIFREYAALSGIAARLGRDFDISGLADLSDTAYRDLAPTRWPVSAARTGGRFFADGQFFTPDRKARMLPLHPRGPGTELSEDYPFRLNTGRVRDHWHTMTRTALSPRLSRHMAEPYLEVHPEDADRLGLQPAGLAQVDSPSGSALLRVLISDRIGKGQVFAPMHWSDETAARARIDALVAPVVDPVSGQPESKASPVRVTPFKAAWFGFAATLDAPDPRCDYWAKGRTATGWQVELAGQTRPVDWAAYARALFGLTEAEELLVIEDRARNLTRLGFARDGILVASLFTGPEPVAVQRAHVIAALGEPVVPNLLSGRASAAQPDPGAIVCSCLNVGMNTILTAIETEGLADVNAISDRLGAGSSCGSCRPEIQALLDARRHDLAAE
ncbi:molybdopterin-dependent oxidoreductase [Fluviibacterium sp. DFM31]|uniref:Molybdopterin-dependent oxidoreductase n=1 Tax=Meridianimarinicoccus marinus TaxID=3231483 RepID=A0ABV3L7A0_9RHOB